MKCFEVSCRYIEQLEEKPKWYNMVFKRKPDIHNIRIHIILYDGEILDNIAKPLLFDKLVEKISDGKSIVANPFIIHDFEAKEISIDSVAISWLRSRSQYVRYLRAINHPEFNWDVYDSLNEGIKLNAGDKIRFVSQSMYMNRRISDEYDSPVFEVDSVTYHFRKEGDEPTSTRISIESKKLRELVIDPVFNNPNEQAEFFKKNPPANPYKNTEIVHTDIINKYTQEELDRVWTHILQQN